LRNPHFVFRKLYLQEEDLNFFAEGSNWRVARANSGLSLPGYAAPSWVYRCGDDMRFFPSSPWLRKTRTALHKGVWGSGGI